jgi:hypothetical protein
MKKIIFFVLLMNVVTTLSAQILVSGSYQLRGTASRFESTFGDEEVSNSTLVFLPRIGYAYKNFVFGVDAGFQRFSSNFETDLEYRSWIVSAYPFARVIKKTNDYLGFWAEGQVGGAVGRYRFSGSSASDSGRLYSFSTGIRPGVIFFVGKHLSFEASYGGLAFETLRIDDDERVNVFQLGLNNAAYGFGVNWLF